MSLRDWIWVLVLGAIWGCSFLFNAILIREIGPLWVSAGRVTIGALGCWGYCIATGRRPPREPALYLGFLFMGVVGFAMPFALFPLSELHLPSGIVAVVNALTPMMTVLVSQVWPGGERATLVKSSGVAIGFIGAVILALPEIGGGTTTWWALGACLLATLCYAVELNYARSFSRIDPAIVAAGALSAAAITAVPLALLFEGVPHMVQPVSWGALLGIGLASTTFAFILMYALLPRVGATNFSITTFVAPVSAVILGIVVLGETILPIQFAGILVIFVGLIIMDGRAVRGMRRMVTGIA